MDADFSIELGSDDPELEFPWAAPDMRFVDLKAHPELVLTLEEALDCPELGDFLAEVNSSRSIFQTAKCDAWFTQELDSEEEIYEAAWKYGAYVDIIIGDENEAERYSFDAHERIARWISDRLRDRMPEFPARAEFAVRRCWFHKGGELTAPVREGFYITAYVFGYGKEEAEAQANFGIALKIVENSLMYASERPYSEGLPPLEGFEDVD